MKINLKKKRKVNKINIILVLIIVIGTSIAFMLKRINRAFTPLIIETAEVEINKFSTIIINKAISQVLEDKINTDKIFETVKSEDGKVQTIDFNPIVVNQVLNVATTVVQENLRMLEKGNIDGLEEYLNLLTDDQIKKIKKGIVTEIPIGVVFKNSLLSNVGPKIPIRLHYIGDVNSNITTKVTPYGINNALVEVGVHLEMTAQIILPFTTDKMKLDCDIPIAIKIIQGNIPNYYGSGLLKDSNLYSIPFESN